MRSANFTANPTNGVVPLTVQFDSASVDSLANIVSWNWVFGDGATTTTPSPSHAYATVGVFAPTLFATNSIGLAVTCTGPQIAVLPTPASCFTFTTNNGAITITAYDCTNGLLAIPSAIGALPVTSIGDEAFSSRGGLTGITIPNSVTNIGYEAFAACTGLINVCFAGAPPADGGSVFTNDAGLTAIYYALGMPGWEPTYDSIPTAPCGQCGGIMAVDFTASPTAGATPLAVQFNCPSVDSFGFTITNWNWDFGDGGTSATQNPIYNYASAGAFTPTLIATNSLGAAVAGYGPQIVVCLTFSTNNGAVTFTGCACTDGLLAIPSAIGALPVTGIGDEALDWCDSLTGITIPNSVTYIGFYAFYQTGLGSITIPNSIGGIGFQAFGHCSSLTNVCFAGNAPADGGSIFAGDSGLTVIYYVQGTSGWGPTYDGIPALPCVQCGPPIPLGFTSVAYSGSNLVYCGTGGGEGGAYYVLSSTDIAAPLAAWAVVATNSFGSNGVFSVTNAMAPGVLQQFLRLQLP